MIREADSPHEAGMEAADTALTSPASLPFERREDRRITEVVRTHHDFVWRLLRRLGVSAAFVEDATQHVFCIAARRIDDIAHGSERSFLFGTALRVASDERRSVRHREHHHAALDDLASLEPNPEELTDKRRKRQLLDEILGAMPMELRSVIVLFELEGMTKVEVAEMLGIPSGTVMSRLRRAREEFKACARRRLAAGGPGKRER